MLQASKFSVYSLNSITSCETPQGLKSISKRVSTFHWEKKCLQCFQDLYKGTEGYAWIL